MSITVISWILFVVTYAGITVGHVPGLTLDRTGIALLGAIAMIATRVISVDQAMAAINAPTVLLLFGLMIVSTQLRLSGFHADIARRLARGAVHPRRFLLLLMIVSGALSAILVNDIICLAFTPIATVALLRARLRPVPYLLGLACASNIGSAATLIGNPQVMLIGQTARLDFGAYVVACALPTMLAIIAAYGVILLLYRGQLEEAAALPTREDSALNANLPAAQPYQMVKGLLITVGVIVFFFTSVPREVTALTAAGILLCSRKMKMRNLLDGVDWSLMLLFCGLFIVVAGFGMTGAPERMVSALAARGMDVTRPATLIVLTSVLSNAVSNLPAVMLLCPFLENASHQTWYVLALVSTFAGNLITIGSIANLIVIEQARHYGVEITFREHARVGVPVTIVSLVIVLFWAML